MDKRRIDPSEIKRFKEAAAFGEDEQDDIENGQLVQVRRPGSFFEREPSMKMIQHLIEHPPKKSRAKKPKAICNRCVSRKPLKGMKWCLECAILHAELCIKLDHEIVVDPRWSKFEHFTSEAAQRINDNRRNIVLFERLLEKAHRKMAA